MNKESENRGRKFTAHCMKIFGSHELSEISTTPNCCKKKIKKYCLPQSKGLPNIKRKKKSERSRSACSTETDCISVYQSWIQIQ